MATDYAADFAILTIVPEAQEAAIAVLGGRTEHRLGQLFVVGKVPAKEGGEHIVVCDRATDRSNQPALEAASRMLRAWKPRVFILADIGGGIYGKDEGDREGVRLGDVVVASNIEYYTLVKELEGGREEPRKFSYLQPSQSPRADLAVLAATNRAWVEEIRTQRPGDPAHTPNIREGEIVVGERLLSDPSSQTVERVLSSYPKAIALDMESVGVARAVYGAQQEGIFVEFAVLRGVSDFIDREGNQATRDAWKRYAAQAAVATAFLLVKNRPARSGVALPPTVRAYLTGFRAQLSNWLSETLRPEQESFPLYLSAGASRGQTPRERDAVALTRQEVLRTVLEERRVVIYGPSGAGKTSTLAYVARRLAGEDKPIIIIVDLKKFEPDWGEQLAEQPIGTRLNSSLDAILRASIEEVSIELFASLIECGRVLLLIDGLNEVGNETAERMLTALEECRRQHGNTCILVTDRRPRPFYEEARWKLIMLPGLREDDTRIIVDSKFGASTFDRLDDGDRRLLILPFFLNEALESGDPRLRSRARGVEAFLLRAGLSDGDLERLAEVSHQAYAKRRNYLEDAETKQLDGEGLLQKLRDAAIVVDRGEYQVFRHQLIHQFLAARYLAPRRRLWNPDVLDAVTADAASLDAVAITLALIVDQVDRDAFLRVVYDWNWRAALVALRETLGAERRISEALEVALLAMAAEKRFDLVSGTRERVEGLLALIPSGYAIEMRAQGSLGALLRFVAALNVTGLDETWKRLFLRTATDGDIPESDFMLIADDEPLLGWTAANTIRRFPGSSFRAGQLRMAYGARKNATPADRAVRWRVVHALGTWPTAVNASFLLQAIDNDEYMWCRYGAVRSVVEMAARTPNARLRAEIISQLKSRIEAIDAEPLGQIAWAALYIDAAPGWCDSVRPLLTAVCESRPPGSTDRSRWEQRLERFESFAQATRGHA